MATVVERVDRLEQTLQDLMAGMDVQHQRLHESQMRTEAELRAFQKEMAVFKDEMKDFKDEARRENREMNRKWGEMANKLGTIVEDLVAPSLPRIVEEVLGTPFTDLYVRHKRRLPGGEVREFDAVVVTTDAVCLNSTKSTLRSADVDRFVEEIAVFRRFCPEFDALPLVGILASLAVDESVLRYAEEMGFVVIAVGDALMEVKNRPGFEPKPWLAAGRGLGAD